MIPFEDVVQGLEGKLLAVRGASRPAAFRRAIIDSRGAEPGDLFVALRGEHQDGHQFVADAFARGAAGALVEDRADLPEVEQSGCLLAVDRPLEALQSLAAWWRAQHPVDVIGITGSVGKTTTKDAVAGLLAQHYSVLKNEGNLNNEIGLPLTLMQLESCHQVLVLEMGMYALGEIEMLCRLARPQIGVVTNVGPTHLERLGTIERIAQAKSELPRSLPADGTAVLNGDDPRVRAMADYTAARVLLYGKDASNDLWADQVETYGAAGTSFTLHWQGGEYPVRTALLGAHSVYASLAAAAVGLTLGLDAPAVARALGDLPGVGRLGLVPGINGSMLIDDTYNASPASVIAALEFLEGLPGRKVAVLGDMLELGSYEAEGHRVVGTKAARVVSALVVLGERGRMIGDAARREGLHEVYYAADRDDAADWLQSHLREGDRVLLKGSRGMAMEQIVARIRG